LEKLSISLLLAFIAGMFFLAYNNPKGYEHLMDKCAELFSQLWLIVVCFIGGVHATYWQLEIPFKDQSFYSYIIPNFSYIWGSAIILFVSFLSLTSLGRLLQSLKSKSSD